jgi:ribonuclease J
MMVFDYENDIIVVDMGLEFPSEDLLGVDYVIPDVSYLEENKKRIRGIIITHGHLDHIGGIPYILPKLDFPALYSTKLTIGLIKKRIEEFNQEKMADLRTIDSNDVLKLGNFTIRFFRVAHSIPDAVGVVIETPAGKIVHTGDFKFDDDLSGDQKPAEIQKMKALGYQNVLAMFSDSTNSLKGGHTMSEKQVGQTLEKIIKEAKNRIIIASFSSLIGRIQQIIEYAKKYNKKIFVSGRSMRENMEIARNLGYLKFDNNDVQDIKKYKNIPDHEALILTTGSQGESTSALTRIANNEHPHIKVKKGDTIVLSASPIIGNERAIFTVVNKLCMLGARVVHNQIMDVHTSGHAYQEEQKEMIDYIKPKFFIPIHGEYFMRQAHGITAEEKCKIPGKNVIMIQNGDVLIAEKGEIYKSTETVDTKYILIDGLGEGQMGSQVQMDREIMSENGTLIVLVHVNKKTRKLIKIPDIVSRGFTYMHESEEITREIAELAGNAYKRIRDKNPGADRQDIKKYIRQTVDKYTHSKIERRPLIVPLIIES